jgi:gliding motility-associated-like protein
MFIKNTYLLFIFAFSYFISIQVWAQTPPKIAASGNQAYCPLSSIHIVETFNLTSGNEPVTVIFIQISIGYNKATDKLEYTGTNPNIKDEIFNTLEGKLELKWGGSGTPNDAEFIDAVKKVVFKSSAINPLKDKIFSITVDKKNYLPKTQHYYEYISAPDITWTEARDAAAALPPYYGVLDPYLATIIYAEEAQICGEQAPGEGWIGGSDNAVEGTWKWVTGPEAGMVFWNGLANGSSPSGVYSNWANGEPNDWPNPNITKEENYAHIYETGKWNDYPNFNTSITGYIVEYGGMPGNQPLDLAKETKIYIPKITSPIAPAPICGSGTATLSATSNTGFVIWFDALSGGNRLGPPGDTYTTPSPISTTTSYYALASSDGICETGERTPVIATVNPLPIIQSAIEFKNCDEDGTADGFTDFNLNEATSIVTNNDANLTVTYHLTASDANTGSGANPINPMPFNNATANTVYARVENSFGCFSVSTVKLSVSSTVLPANFNYELAACDIDGNADGFYTFDLAQASTVFINQLPAGQPLSVYYFRTLDDAQLEQNEIQPANYTNETKDSQILYVRIENENDGNCFGIGPFLTLTVQQIPQFEVIPSATVCLNLPPITLQTLNPQGIYSYEWTNANGTIISQNSSAEVAEAGIYTVIATSVLNCESFPKTVTVTASDITTISMDIITVVDDSDNNSIAVNKANLGIGDYEFALDSQFGPFQDEPYFEHLSLGIHTLYVNDKNSCGVAVLDIAILGFPKFFTPNGDGQNDTWKIHGNDTNNIQISAIYVYDRFGKLVADVDLTGDGWDGFYNSERLPSADYWYLVKFLDQFGDYREKQGHFSLIRR